MAAGLFQRISGREGEVRIESLGVLVGTFQSWTLTRRGDDGPRADLYDLHAVFSYVNPHLWDDDDYVKAITVMIGKQKFGIEQEEGFETVVDGRRSLRMKGVRLCQ
jgi:hypothetical protein